MNRFNTPLFGSLFCIASMSRIRSAIFAGGNARKQGPSLAFGHTTNVSSVPDRKSTRLNSSHSQISYAVFCLKKKKKNIRVIDLEKTIRYITMIQLEQ